ncbi:MAG: His/Gly/Thr/Pro-type tRNA ligase C-terminal domain-containing protein, partial [Saprospiraceae bacterium]
GALETYTIEAMMQDGKALQAGTSHYLGQNFAKAFGVKFLTDQNKEEYVYATSWGVSTRLIGALVMTHSDDDGLILPPRLAPIQVAIVPIPKPSTEIDEVSECIMNELKSKGIKVIYDRDEKNRPGYKFAEYELKGVPVRIGIGARDLEKSVVEIARRDTKEKELVSIDQVTQYVEKLLADIQINLFEKAKALQQSKTHHVSDWSKFEEILKEEGGFVYAHWDGSSETEELIKEKTKATIRCIPMDDGLIEEGQCILSGKPSKGKVLFAKAY